MNPETRAARDRLARYASPDAPPYPPFKVGPEVAGFTPQQVQRLIAQITEGIRDTLAPDVNAVLAALDRLHAENRLHEALRDRPPGTCGRVRAHAPHRWLPSRSALDCPGIPWAGAAQSAQEEL
jgi:hypothetical protein